MGETAKATLTRSSSRKFAIPMQTIIVLFVVYLYIIICIFCFLSMQLRSERGDDFLSYLLVVSVEEDSSVWFQMVSLLDRIDLWAGLYSLETFPGRGK